MKTNTMKKDTDLQSNSSSFQKKSKGTILDTFSPQTIKQLEYRKLSMKNKTPKGAPEDSIEKKKNFICIKYTTLI